MPRLMEIFTEPQRRAYEAYFDHQQYSCSPIAAGSLPACAAAFRSGRVSCSIRGKKIEADRVWETDEPEENTYFLQSKVLSVKGGEAGGTATRFVHLPKGLFKTLNALKPDVVIAGEYNFSAVQVPFSGPRPMEFFVNMTDGTLRPENWLLVRCRSDSGG